MLRLPNCILIDHWVFTICTENCFSVEMSNGTVDLVKIFRNRRNAFNWNDQDTLYYLQKSHSCHSLTHDRRLCEPWHYSPQSTNLNWVDLDKWYSIIFWPIFTARNILFHLSQKSHPKIPCKWNALIVYHAIQFSDIFHLLVMKTEAHIPLHM